MRTSYTIWIGSDESISKLPERHERSGSFQWQSNRRYTPSSTGDYDHRKSFRRTACSIKFSDMRGEFGFSSLMKNLQPVRIPLGNP